MLDFQNPAASYVTTDQVNPSVFVKQTGQYTVATAGAGNRTIGVSQPNDYLFNVSYAAASGGSLAVYTEAQECWLTAGGTVTANDLLKSDSTGRGVTAASTNNYGAVALQSGTVGQLIRVRIQTGVAP